jgi:pimeloyl-ACP methyl ester carboxylesterase
MQAIHDRAPVGTEQLLVMLPGALDKPQDLVQRGFVQAVRERTLPLDVIVADAHTEYYLQHRVVERLALDIIEPARSTGYRHIWLMGISLGGLGSLSYLRAHSAHVEGVFLLAPFLGTRGLIAEVTRAGGLDGWLPGAVEPDDDERDLLAWLKSYRADDPTLPPIWLGYGREDRFAPASELLAPLLPPARVVTVSGGHDWDTWQTLWRQLLMRNLFAIR